MLEQRDLDGKVVLVTGGSRGIGAAIARTFATCGALVVICGRNEEALRNQMNAINTAGGKCKYSVCDISRLADVEALAQKVNSSFARLDVLVNNAGIGAFGGPLHTMPPEKWDAILNTNLRGVFYMLRSFVPLIASSGGGDIVNISSLAGKNALPNGAAYAASKWALNGLSYSVAEELRSLKIRVSVICPGSTYTELGPHTGKDPNKMLQPEDVAHIVKMIVTQAPQSFASEVLLRPTQKP